MANWTVGRRPKLVWEPHEAFDWHFLCRVTPLKGVSQDEQSTNDNWFRIGLVKRGESGADGRTGIYGVINDGDPFACDAPAD